MGGARSNKPRSVGVSTYPSPHLCADTRSSSHPGRLKRWANQLPKVVAGPTPRCASWIITTSYCKHLEVCRNTNIAWFVSTRSPHVGAMVKFVRHNMLCRCGNRYRKYIHIAKQARDAFSMLLASSITMMLIIEAAFNLGVVLGILPPKGLVLPFISYGSSALMCNMWAIGILLSISSEKRDLPLEQGWKIPKESA